MDTFGHIRMVIGFILSLSIARLLVGAVKLIQHPGRTKPYPVHLLWAFYIFLLLTHFWWWEFKLKSMVQEWQFQEYFFIIVFITMYFTLCALLFPDDLKDYQAEPNEKEQGTPFRRSTGGYETYFYSRRKWFFGVLAASFVADVIDTAMKGKDYLLHFGWEYPVRNSVHFILCLVAMQVSSRKFHTVLVILFLLYEISYILRLFGTVG